MTPVPTPTELASRSLLNPQPGQLHFFDLFKKGKDGLSAKDLLSDYIIGMPIFAVDAGIIKAWEGTLIQVPFTKGFRLRKGKGGGGLLGQLHLGRPFLGPDGKVLRLSGVLWRGGDDGKEELEESDLTSVDAIQRHPNYDTWLSDTFYCGKGKDDGTYVQVETFDSLKRCDENVNSKPYVPGPLSISRVIDAKEENEEDGGDDEEQEAEAEDENNASSSRFNSNLEEEKARRHSPRRDIDEVATGYVELSEDDDDDYDDDAPLSPSSSSSPPAEPAPNPEPEPDPEAEPESESEPHPISRARRAKSDSTKLSTKKRTAFQELEIEVTILTTYKDQNGHRDTTTDKCGVRNSVAETRDLVERSLARVAAREGEGLEVLERIRVVVKTGLSSDKHKEISVGSIREAREFVEAILEGLDDEEGE